MLVGTIGYKFGNEGPEIADIKFPTLEKLTRLYKEHGASNPVCFTSNCIQCGDRVELELHETSQGFGINGGFLFVTEDDHLLSKCVNCHKQLDRSRFD